MDEETHLGDGVYCYLEGGMIKLRVERVYGDHVIYLEPEVLNALNAFAVQVGFPIKPVEPNK